MGEIASSDADSQLDEGPRCVERARNLRHQPGMSSGVAARMRCGFDGVQDLIATVSQLIAAGPRLFTECAPGLGGGQCVVGRRETRIEAGECDFGELPRGSAAMQCQVGGRDRGIGEGLPGAAEEMRVIGEWHRAVDRVHCVTDERGRGSGEGEWIAVCLLSTPVDCA
jgi:hypothetical protein